MQFSPRLGLASYLCCLLLHSFLTTKRHPSDVEPSYIPIFRLIQLWKSWQTYDFNEIMNAWKLRLCCSCKYTRVVCMRPIFLGRMTHVLMYISPTLPLTDACISALSFIFDIPNLVIPNTSPYSIIIRHYFHDNTHVTVLVILSANKATCLLSILIPWLLIVYTISLMIVSLIWRYD